MADAEHVVLSTRIATLILLLYGTPVSKTCELTKEIDPASLADLLGYSTQVMNLHAARAAVPMATYPAMKHPTR